MNIAPFSIHVAVAVLGDLQLRLNQARFDDDDVPAPSDGHHPWRHGTSREYLRELIDDWRTRFSWAQQEAALNQLPHFTAKVADGEQLHFIHQRARAPGALPLLLLHGWPDSFYRYVKVLPRLGGEFDVVVPSLPGFGFTGALDLAVREQPNRHSAELLWRLMTEGLGYRRFGVAGGDGGSALAQILAIDHPESVVGIHLTDLGWHVNNTDPASLSRAERSYLAASKKQMMADGAYAMVQMQAPNSLAPALSDSPVALASWIVDRFHSWSDNDGDLDHSFSKDELLTNIMIYWITGTIGSSIASYRAEALSPSLTVASRVKVPVAMALFPKDIGGIPPRAFAERTVNVQRWTEMPRGSHLAALEEPALYAADVSAFFKDSALHA
ncbi:MAG TPA: epoxide hydrolase [Polyangiaceae bacterium]